MFFMNKDYINKYKSAKGFTLIELGAVLMVAGFVMVAAVQFVKLYSVNQNYEITLENLKITQEALNEYKGLIGRYPCPADPTLGPGSANYGLERCRSTSDINNNPDDCTDTISVLGGITCIDGAGTFARDGDENGQPDVIMIGAVPFRTLADTVVSTNFREAHKQDGYNTLITYAVTEHMTSKNFTLTRPVNPWTGAIKVVDENKIDVTIPESSAHYVVFSHGENQRGGYTANGQQKTNCNVSQIVIVAGIPTTVDAPAPPGMTGDENAGETENCDTNDAVFLQGIRVMADGKKYNDDILYYKGVDDIPLWRRSLASPDGESYIFNTNLGNVGIGTATPEERLHIYGGNFSVESHVDSPEYCDENDICLNPIDLGGVGSTCPNPTEAAYGIEDGKLVCRDVDWDANIKGNACGTTDVAGVPTATYIRGMSNKGNLLCCTKDANNCCLQSPGGGACVPVP